MRVLSLQLSLKPFEVINSSSLSLSVDVSVNEQQWLVTYILKGKMYELAEWPFFEKRPTQGENLWRQTVFELFWSEDGEAYEELNITPALEWQHFSLKKYRVYKQAYREWGHDFMASGKRIIEGYEFSICLWNMPRQASFLPAVILKGANNKLSYWAPAHPHSGPDFHSMAHFLDWESLSES